MKVTIMFSCSRTRRVASTQKGLMCPIGYSMYDQKGIAVDDNSYPKL
jgi:hypothetical protein